MTIPAKTGRDPSKHSLLKIEELDSGKEER